MHTRRLLAVLLLVAAAAGCGDDSSAGSSTVSIGEATVPAGESGDIVVTVQRSGGSSGAISVPYTTRDDSAVEVADYVAASGSVEFADGDTEPKTFTISLVDDVVIESVESLVIELGEPSNDAKLGANSVMAQIVDDDHPGDSFAVTSAGRLVHFDRAEPGRLTWSVELSGLGTESVIGLDIRPADGLLYALTDSAKLYTIDPMTGAATAKSTLVADAGDVTSPFTSITGAVDIDFNPVVDRLRVTTDTGLNLRINVDTGAVITDTAINGLSTGYSAVAYNNNVAPACRTTLYAIDVATNRFLSQNPANDGIANGIGGLGIDATANGGFDVSTDGAGVSTGFAILTVGGSSGMYVIDLASGAATVARDVVGPLPAGETVKSFAVATLAPDAPTTQLPGELYGVTDTSLVSFNRAAPAKLCTSKPIGGLAVNEEIVSLDMRPSTGVLYVLTKIGTAGKLHRVDPATGNLSPVIPISVALSGSDFDIDFNPTGVAALRIISDSGQNLRVTDLTTGATTADTALNGVSTAATGAAYTDSVQGAGTTTLYMIDPTTDRLRVSTSPNAGTLADVGPLGVDVTDVAGFDIDGRDNSAVVVVTTGTSSQLHNIDLATGAVSASLGTIAGGALRGVTRVTPQTNVYGITTDNKLVRISLADPSMVTVISDPELMPPVSTITGVTPGETLVGIDVRPGTNVMYAIGSQGSLYTLNSSTAAANKLGAIGADPTDTTSPFAALSGTSFGVDFNPTATVGLRVVSNTEQNLRLPNVSVSPPKAFTDTALSFGSAVDVTAAAYTNSFVAPAGVTPSTTLYVIDAVGGQLMSQVPNDGTLTAVGALGAGTIYDAAAPTASGFDIAGGNNGIAIAAFQRPLETFSRLYRINLATGAATEIGTGVGGAPLLGLAVQIR